MRINILVCVIMFFQACSGVKDVTKFKSEDEVISLKKGPCQVNNCSVYNVTLYKNQYAVYEGITNVERFGLFYKKLTKEQLKDLTDRYDKANFTGFKDSYYISDPDLPVITMTYRSGKIVKSVKGSIDRPQEVLDLQRHLEKFAKSDGWILVKAYDENYSHKPIEQKTPVKEEVIDDQIIVEPASSGFMAQWLKKYPEYDIQLIKKISPNLNYWLISFNKQKISPKEMLSILKKDIDLKHVEFNKKVMPRDH